MDKIQWCLGKREGLSIVEPNSNLANAYIKKQKKLLHQ